MGLAIPAPAITATRARITPATGPVAAVDWAREQRRVHSHPLLMLPGPLALTLFPFAQLTAHPFQHHIPQCAASRSSALWSIVSASHRQCLPHRSGCMSPITTS
jgi:hypothetical protein